MKFKVINEDSKEVIAVNLDIDIARKIARAYNRTHKADIFMISSQAEEMSYIPPHKNGEVITELIDREIRQFITIMTDNYPNDTELGAEIRKYII
jgi:hypothetical protein